MKRTVINMLHEAAVKFEGKTYLAEKGDNSWIKYTFKETDLASDYIAIALQQHGIASKEKIAIVSEGRISWVVGEFGVLKAAAIAVPLSVKLLPEELLFRLNHSESKAILVSSNNLEKIIQIYNRLECTDFKIIYLDNDIDKAKLRCAAQGINFDTAFLLFDSLLEEGKSKYEQEKSALKKLENEIDENDVVTISYTSGTTGNPKGIMLTHLNYFANSHGSQDLFHMEFGLKTLIILPLDHSFAHTVGIYISLIVQISIYFVDSRGGGMKALKNIPINLKEVKPNLLLTVPALSGNFMKKIQEGIEQKGGFIEKLFNKGLENGIEINGDGYRKASFFIRLWKGGAYWLAKTLIFKKLHAIFGGELEFMVGGGALLDIKQQKFYNAIGIPVMQGYGLTEATPIICANTLTRHKFGTSGNVLPNIVCKIINDGQEQSIGQKGEIVIKGDNVMKGYFKNSEATAKTLKNGWLYTGDMAYYDKDDFLVVTGREKALLISQDGEKYSPEEIEEGITNTSPFVAQCVLYNDHSPFTTAVITLEEAFVKSFINKNNIKTTQELFGHIEKSVKQFSQEKEYVAKFPGKWHPTAFVIAEELFSEENKLLNSTMKVVRYKVIEYYKERLEKLFEKGKKSTLDENMKVIAHFF